MSNWDTLFYTRNFPSINSERAKRHVSKLLTYPMTMASVMHRLGPYAGSRGGLDGRLTAEGSRSMAGKHASGLYRSTACLIADAHRSHKQRCTPLCIPPWAPALPLPAEIPKHLSESSFLVLVQSRLCPLTCTNKCAIFSPTLNSTFTSSDPRQLYLHGPCRPATDAQHQPQSLRIVALTNSFTTKRRRHRAPGPKREVDPNQRDTECLLTLSPSHRP